MKKVIVSALVSASIVFGLGQIYLNHTTAFVPMCDLEDGSDVDGLCIWIDPDTGDAYANPTQEEVK